MKLLIINPGSTSTKISVYEDENKLFEENIFHDAPELLKYPHVNGQIPFRKKVVLDLFDANERKGYNVVKKSVFSINKIKRLGWAVKEEMMTKMENTIKECKQKKI